jgi:hypothetical protein
MTVDFTVTDNILNVLFEKRETPLIETENGVVGASPNLYSLVTDDGVLTATDRIPPKPTSPLGVLWIGTCTIYEYQDVTDPETFQTKHELFPVVVNEPCRVSYKRETSTNINTGAPEMQQVTMLFIRPDLEIKAGSVINITQHGRTIKYKRSSKPALYSEHQEVMLELYEENA